MSEVSSVGWLLVSLAVASSSSVVIVVAEIGGYHGEMSSAVLEKLF